MADKRELDHTRGRELRRTDERRDLGSPHEPELTQRLPQGLRDRLTPQHLRFAVIMVTLAVVSFFFIAGWASAPETYAGTIATLDEKKSTVMGLVGASSGASAGISFLPGDAGTPIAEKLMDLSSDFLIVIAAIYLEKYLLTILGFVSFRILIPVACLFAAGSVLVDGESVARRALQQWAFRLGVFAIAAWLVVPCSTFISGMIEATYESSINDTVAAAEQTTDDIEQLSEDAGETDLISGIVSTVTGGASDLIAQANTVLNDFVEALAVMIVTSCVIPLLVLLFFLWLVRAILGIDISVPEIPGARGIGARTLSRRR